MECGVKLLVYCCTPKTEIGFIYIQNNLVLFLTFFGVTQKVHQTLFKPILTHTHLCFWHIIPLKLRCLNFMTKIQVMSPESFDFGQHFLQNFFARMISREHWMSMKLINTVISWKHWMSMKLISPMKSWLLCNILGKYFSKW